MNRYLRPVLLFGCIALIVAGAFPFNINSAAAQAATPMPTLPTGRVPITAATINRLELLFTSSAIVPEPFALSPDSKVLAVRIGHDIKLHQFNAITDPPRELESAPVMITALAFSPDGSLLAGGGFNADGGKLTGVIGIWDVASGKQRATVTDEAGPSIGPVNSVAFNPDGSLLAAGGMNGLGLWRVSQDGKIQAGPPVKDQVIQVMRVAFSPDGTLLSATSGSGFMFWSFNDTRKLPPFQGKAIIGNGLAFSPDGLRVALVGNSPGDSDLSLWELSTGKQTILPYPIDGDYTPAGGAVSFSPDGSLVAATNASQTAQVWDVKTGKVVVALHATTPEKKNSTILGVAFSPDGTLLIGTAFEGIWIWGVKG